MSYNHKELQGQLKDAVKEAEDYARQKGLGLYTCATEYGAKLLDALTWEIPGRDASKAWLNKILKEAPTILVSSQEDRQELFRLVMRIWMLGKMLYAIYFQPKYRERKTL